MSTEIKNLLPASILILAIACVYTVFWPGLKGPLLLDDYPVLEHLAVPQSLGSIEGIETYLTSLPKGAKRRPLSMLSFSINGASWPLEAYGFKLTNLHLHVITGLLLAWLSFKLAMSLGAEYRKSAWISVLCASMWLLHPLHLSTVLYVVQRMAILSALFSIASLICYLWGRSQLLIGDKVSGYLLLIVGTAFFGILGALSKENAVLIPLLIGIIEFVLLGKQKPPLGNGYKRWRYAYIFAPILILFSYFLFTWPDPISGYKIRDFDLQQRLLTQFRVVSDYLLHIIIPKIQTTGLNHDGIIISTGLMTPVSTLPSAIGITGLFVISLLSRKKYPIWSAAILFYFAGHILESTFLPLEMYFEHRNYLPDMLLFFALSYSLVTTRKLNRQQRKAASLIIIILLATFTFLRAQLWSNTLTLATSWAANDPFSVRSQNYAARALWEEQRFGDAHVLLTRAARNNPESTTISLMNIYGSCLVGKPFSKQLLTDASRNLSHQVLSEDELSFFEYLISLPRLGVGCDPQYTGKLHQMIAATLANPASSDTKALAQLYTLKGSVYLLEKNTDLAMTMFNNSMHAYPSSNALKKQIDDLNQSGYQILGRVHGEKWQKFSDN